jgi:hypothetical protein
VRPPGVSAGRRAGAGPLSDWGDVDRPGECTHSWATGSSGAGCPSAGHAARVLAGRLVDPLIDQLDAGQSVTFGPLIVSRSGISSYATTVAWQDVDQVSFRLYGQRVQIATARGHSAHDQARQRAECLPRPYVIEYAAREAGVGVVIG